MMFAIVIAWHSLGMLFYLLSGFLWIASRSLPGVPQGLPSISIGATQCFLKEPYFPRGRLVFPYKRLPCISLGAPYGVLYILQRFPRDFNVFMRVPVGIPEALPTILWCVIRGCFLIPQGFPWDCLVFPQGLHSISLAIAQYFLRDCLACPYRLLPCHRNCFFFLGSLVISGIPLGFS